MPGSGSDHAGLPESAPSGPIAVQAELNSYSAVGAVAAGFAHGSPPAHPAQVPDHQLLRKIGGGSYGEVWLARNTLGTLRAVKIVYRHVFEDNRPFEREFRGIQRFEPISRSHEGLVDILQVGSAEDHFYYVMELADPISNPNLESRNPTEIRNPQSPTPNSQSLCDPSSYAPRTLRAELKARGCLSASECVGLGLGLARALAHLHQHGLVHRDVKPSNIIFVGGVPKLADIGLVADLSDARSFVGTEGFIPPEGPGAPQADLYGLGKVLYEATTGKDRRDFPRLPTGFTSKAGEDSFLELNAVIVKACKSDPRERYRTAEEMAGDLTLLEQGKSVKRRRAWQRQVAHSIKATAVVGVLALGLVLGPALARRLRAPPTSVPASVSIAVLPVRASGENAQHNDLCERIADGFASALGQIEGVSVARRKWVLALTEESSNLNQFADRLAVEKALTVRLTNPGEEYRLSVGWLEFPLGTLLWQDSRDVALTNLVRVETTLVEQIATRLNLELTATVLERIHATFRDNHAAYELVRQAWGDAQQGTRAGDNLALEKLSRARELDRGYREIYVLLYHIYYEQPDLAPRQRWTMCMGEIGRLLELDEEDPWGLLIQGGYLVFTKRDVEGGLNMRKRAAELDAGAGINLGVDLEQQGKLDEAWAIWQRMLQEQPRSSYTRSVLVNHLFIRRQYDAALTEAEVSLGMFPEKPGWYYYQARCHEQQGRHDQAIELMQKAQAIKDEPSHLSALAHMYVQSGKLDEARTLLQKLEELSRQRYVDPAYKAAVHVALNETDAAFVCLEQSIDDLSDVLVHAQMWSLRYDPYWDPLRDDPRFNALFSKLWIDP